MLSIVSLEHFVKYLQHIPNRFDHLNPRGKAVFWLQQLIEFRAEQICSSLGVGNLQVCFQSHQRKIE